MGRRFLSQNFSLIFIRFSCKVIMFVYSFSRRHDTRDSCDPLQSYIYNSMNKENLSVASSASEKGKGDGGYQTGFIRWRATDGGFSGWTLNGVKLNAGALEFDSATASAGTDSYAPGAFNGGNYYNG